MSTTGEHSGGTLLIVSSNKENELEKSFEEHFAPFQQQLNEWKEKVKTIVVNGEDDTEMMAEARKARLALVKVRTATEARHSEVKEEYLRPAQLIDKIKKRIVDDVKEMEADLAAKEKFAENAARERRIKLHNERALLLAPFIGKETDQIQLADLSPMAFDAMLRGYKSAEEERKANEQREREQKEQREKEQREQNEKQQRENALLKLKGDRINKLLNAGGKLVDNDTCIIIQDGQPDGDKFLQAIEPLATINDFEFGVIQARFDQIERAKKDREQKERERLQKLEQEKKDKANADRRLKRAPDKVKLTTLADRLTEFMTKELPECKETEAIEVVNGVSVLLGKVVAYINKGVKTLEE